MIKIQCFQKKNLNKRPKPIFTTYQVQNPISIIDIGSKLNYHY